MSFYSLAAWKKLRRVLLSQRPMCVDCERRGIHSFAEEVDHIDPISHGGDPWDEENLQPLCKSCHSRKTAVDSGRRDFMVGCDLQGHPTDPRHPWNKKG